MSRLLKRDFDNIGSIARKEGNKKRIANAWKGTAC